MDDRSSSLHLYQGKTISLLKADVLKLFLSLQLSLFVSLVL